MILVADSGSSRSDWMLSLPFDKPLTFTTKGLNPYFVSEKEIERVIHNVSEIIPFVPDITEVYFFGSGCTSPDRREIVSNALTELFSNAFISVELDLLGSAYATCGNRKGYVATLGTGSDFTFYNGEEIEVSKQGVGYVLGDEGSGVWFGKRLITDYLYGKMPADLELAFSNKFRVNKEIVVKNVYQKSMPNTYIASFVPFLSEHSGHPYVESLLEEGFSEFVQVAILPHDDYKDFVCHFVGSIAYFFEPQLKQVCQKFGVQMGMILKNPMEKLFEFILEREKNYSLDYKL